MANKLVEKYDITIFTLYAKGELEQELNNKIHLISLYEKKYQEFSKMEKISISLSVLVHKRKIFEQYINSEKYDVQVAFLEGPVTRIFSTKSKKSKAKKIAWVHNDISRVFGKSIKSRLKRIIDRNAYEKYDTLVFVSRDNLDRFNKTYDDMLLPKERVIYNYIEPNRILQLSEKKQDELFKNNEVNILQVSRLVEQKGIERLIDAHAKLIDEGMKHHIYIIGDGPLKEKLKNKIKEKNIEDTFTLLGAKENPYPYLKNTDFVCLFSKFEGYGIVIDEAKILKKHVLITDTAAKEALADYQGYSKIVPNNTKGIEEAIRYAIKNKDRILQKNVKYDYTNSKIIDKIENIIEE